jgi:phosphate transport system substrate-binding protein
MAARTRLAVRMLAAFAVASALAAAALAAPVVLRGAGSTAAAPLIDNWIAMRARSEANVAVRYSPIGSSEGIRSLLAGRVEFAVTERPLTHKESAATEGEPVSVPVIASMVVLAYNLPGVTAPLRLSRGTLAGIFSGAVKAWNDPRIRADNPGLALPARTIALVVRREGSGTTYALATHLAAIDPSWAGEGRAVNDQAEWPYAMAVFGNEGVAGRIARTEYSLGYMEYGFARRLGLATALLQNRAGAFVEASAESGAAALANTAASESKDGWRSVSDPAGAAAYPLVTYTWLVIRSPMRSTESAGALREFVGFGLSPAGQAEGARIGYLPLPPATVQEGEAALRSVR